MTFKIFLKRLFIILLLFSIILLIYWAVPYSPFKSNFDKEMEARLSKVEESKEICRKEEIDSLPKAMKNHCYKIGLLGQEKHQVVNVNFKQADFLFNTEKNTQLKIDYDLWLFFDRPFRTAYISSNIMGIPFDGIDYMEDRGWGGMKGFIGKAFQLFDENNEQMYQAGLISLLAEGAGLNPSFLLLDYIEYEEINDKEVLATISYNGVQGQGVFTFNEEGFIEKFESDQRQVEKVNGVETRLGWRAIYKDYKEVAGILVPKSIQAIKVYPEKEVVYFDSKESKISWYK